MKRFFTVALMMLLLATTAYSQVTSLWEKSQNTGNFPSYLAEANTERGFAFGTQQAKTVSFETTFELSSALGNYPTWLGDGSTERGFAYGEVNVPYITMTELWGLTQANGTYPAFMGTGSTERGFAYGNGHVYVASRNGGLNIVIVDATNGDSVGTLDMTGVEGGFYGLALMDVGVADDGKIYACNLSGNDGADKNFKVYMWETEASAPVVVIDEPAYGGRFGDKFTVVGSADDNSLQVWAVRSAGDSVYKFTTTDNGVTFTNEKVVLSDGSVGSSPSAFPGPDGTEFYVSSNGRGVTRYQADGTALDTLSTSYVPSQSNSLVVFELQGKKYLAIYNYSTDNENIRIYDVTNGADAAPFILMTEPIGDVSNGNGVGDVDFDVKEDGTADVYILGTNNGVAGYNFNPASLSKEKRVLVASRKSGLNIIVADATTGDSLGALDMTGVAGGFYGLALMDAEIGADGKIYACNLSGDDGAQKNFIVYKWDHLNATPEIVLDYNTEGARLGDKFSVVGSEEDNSVKIYAAKSAGNLVYEFTTEDNGATFTANVITLSDGAAGSSPAVYPLENGEFLFSANGTGIKHYQSDGTLIDEVPTSIVSSQSNALVPFKAGDKQYIAIYCYSTNNEHAKVFDVTDGYETAELVMTTPTMGEISNGNGVGDVALIDKGDGIVDLAVFATNNGVGVYVVDANAHEAMDRLYIASRNGGLKMIVVDATTGDSVGALDMTGVEGGFYGLALMDAEVSDDGVIFACNLSGNDGAQKNFKVYRWNDEMSAPQVVIDYDTQDARLGDKFTVVGSAENNTLEVYAVKSAGNIIYKFTTEDNGMTFTAEEITLNSGNMGSSPAVYPSLDGTELYVNSNGSGVYSFSMSGEPIDTLGTDVITSQSNALRIFNQLNKTYIATYCYSTDNENLRIYDITDGLGNAKQVAATNTLGAVSNANGVGDVDIKLGEEELVNLYILATNNGVAAYNYESIVVNEVANIGEFLSGTTDEFYKITGQVIVTYVYELNKFYVQDTSGAIFVEDIDDVVETEYMEGDAIVNLTGKLVAGDVPTLQPMVDPGNPLSSDNEIPVFEYTTEEFNVMPLTLVNLYIRIPNVLFDDADGSAVFEANNTYAITEGENSVLVKAFESTNLVGSVIPMDLQNVSGIVVPEGDGYAIAPRSMDDIMWIPPAPEEMYTIWEQSSGKDNMPSYFSPNSERGMAYGIVGDMHRLYVVAKLGGPMIVAHDAITGDSLKVIPSPEDLGMQPGYFKMNCVEVSEDGYIFACNMTLNANTDTFVVYRWDDEVTAPRRVIEYVRPVAPNNRMGDAFTTYGSVDDNSIAIYAGISGTDSLVKFTTQDYGETFDAEVIPLNGAEVSTVPTATESSDTSFYFKSYSKPCVHYSTSGEVLDSIPTWLVTTSVTNIKYGEIDGRKFLLTYEAEVEGNGGKEKAKIIDCTNGWDKAFVAYETPSLGQAQNLNATGVVEFMKYEDSYVLFVLGTNNGLGMFATDSLVITGTEDDEIIAVPTNYTLDQNYPNPFNPTTTISFGLPVASNVTVKVFNVLGEMVTTLIDNEMTAGFHTVNFNATHLASGMYLYILKAQGADGTSYQQTKKMLLLK